MIWLQTPPGGVFHSLEEMAEYEEKIEELKVKALFPDQQDWSEAVLDYCLAYLKETYEEKWIRFEPKEQDQPYFELNDGAFLALTIVPGLHGIVVEIAENEADAYNYMFEDANIIYEGFDRIDALRQLKDCTVFFALETLEKFEAMPEQEKSQFETGYYDCAYLRYLLISDGGCVSDGVRE